MVEKKLYKFITLESRDIAIEENQYGDERYYEIYIDKFQRVILYLAMALPLVATLYLWLSNRKKCITVDIPDEPELKKGFVFSTGKNPMKAY